ncbi:MAG: hypothetical protein ABI621_20320 [Chloroflexota bacterium]
MSRLTKYLSLLILLLFILACSTVTQPIQDAQNLAGTAQSFASALPMETLKALTTQIPIETFQALPSAAPTLAALASAMPDFEGYFNPEGTPVSEWNGIPIMPQATAGEEFTDSSTYSFKVDASVKEAQDFYSAELIKLGWTSSFSMPGGDTVAVQLFQKDDSMLTVTITDVNGSVVVILTLT